MRFLSLLPFALLLVPASAHATASFPAAIVTDLNVTCAKPIWDGNGCTICHTTNAGQCGTVNKPFGVWLRQRGLTCPAPDPALLDQLLDEADTLKVDTNCDGVADVDQLRTCQWEELATTQNTCDAGPSTLPAVDVTYGCAQSGHMGKNDVGAGTCAVVLACLLFFKRRRWESSRAVLRMK
jgi:hypothetical protein